MKKVKKQLENVFVPNWDSFISIDDWIRCFEMIFKIWGISLTEEAYYRLSDRSKRYFKLQEPKVKLRKHK